MDNWKQEKDLLEISGNHVWVFFLETISIKIFAFENMK
jgi:hypothetical protein